MGAAMKPFLRPALWLGLWCAAVVLVVVFSLISAPSLPEVPQGGDKVEHFLAYALLSAGAVQLWGNWRVLRAVAIGLVCLGVALEFAQGLLTSTRMFDPMDALANTVGVIGGLLSIFTPWQDLLLRWDQRWQRG